MDRRWQGVGGGFKGGIFDLDDVADAIDEQREESLVGAHDHEHRLPVGVARGKAKPATKVDGRDDLAAEIEQAFDVGRGERHAGEFAGAQDFLHGEHIETEKQVGHLEGAELDGGAHGFQAARLSPAPALRGGRGHRPSR